MIAGNGRFPFLVLEAARAAGHQVTIIALKEEASADLEAEAAKAYKTLEQNPELAVFLQKLASMEQVSKERATLILDQNTPPFDLLRGTNSIVRPAGKK